jgi:hypothetical protein
MGIPFLHGTPSGQVTRSTLRATLADDYLNFGMPAITDRHGSAQTFMAGITFRNSPAGPLRLLLHGASGTKAAFPKGE